jgi:hypothetical protein
MRLYSGTTKSLIEDSTYNRVTAKLKDAFFLEFRYQFGGLGDHSHGFGFDCRYGHCPPAAWI